jgi:hypothetical protein
LQSSEHKFRFFLPSTEYFRLLIRLSIRKIDPNEVVGLVINKGMNLVKAWRTHLGLTQAEVAKKAQISQEAALSQMERKENKLRTATL